LPQVETIVTQQTTNPSIPPKEPEKLNPECKGPQNLNIVYEESPQQAVHQPMIDKMFSSDETSSSGRSSPQTRSPTPILPSPSAYYQHMSPGRSSGNEMNDINDYINDPNSNDSMSWFPSD
jgi:hypothetical protein